MRTQSSGQERLRSIQRPLAALRRFQAPRRHHAASGYSRPAAGGSRSGEDVLELGRYQCYARITDARTGERLPAFRVQFAPPPVGDTTQAIALARASAEKYGRDALDVELDLQSALHRIAGPRRGITSAEPGEAATPVGSGIPAAAGVIAGAEMPERRARSSTSNNATRRAKASDEGQEVLEPWREFV